MKPNTAACFVLSGLSLWLIQLQLSEPKGPRIRNIQVARFLSGVVGLVGLLTLAEYLLHLNWSFDEVLFSSKLLDGGALHPGRMAGATAFGFLLLGASVLLSTTRDAYLAQSLSLLAALDGFVASAGYVLGARSLYAVQPYSSMALLTAILFLLLGLATLAARPESGFMAVVTSPNLGGVMVRRVLPTLLLIVLLLVWLRWQGQLAGLYGAEFGITLFAVSEVVTIVGLFWVSAWRINRLDLEHRQAESQRRLLAAIVESSQDAILSKDLSGNITSWNQGAERLYGYSAAEIVGKPIAILMPEGIQEEATQFLRKISLGQQVTEDTVRRRRDGSLIHVALAISPVRDLEGQIVGASAIAHDINDRKRAEQVLLESERQFRTLCDSMPQLAWRANPDGWIYWYNQRWYQYTGTTLDQMQGWGWKSVHDPATLPKVMEKWQASIATGESFDMVFPLRGADGAFRPFLTRVVPVKNAEGGVVHWFGTNTDISEQKGIEDALRESEERFHAFMDNVPAIAWAKDEQGKHVYLNRAYERAFGVRRENSYGKTDFELWDAEMAVIFRRADEAVLAANKPIEVIENTWTSGDGHRTWQNVKFPFQDSKDRRFVGGIGIDVTEKHLNEERLREYARVVEDLEEMILVVDRQYRYVIANRAFLKFRGMSAEQVVGHFVHEVIGENTFVTTVKEKMDECFQGQVVQYEMTYDFPNLGKRELFVSYFPIESSSGIDRIGGVLQDITDRKLAEEALRKSEERFSKAFRDNPLAISISTETGGRFLDVNHAFVDLLGYRRQDVIGHTAAELSFWVEPSDRIGMLQQLKEEGRVAKRHIRYQTAKGEIREADTWTESIELDGQRCLLGITHDITEIQHLEAQLRQAQKMEAVGRLAGGVAHDFNNLLGVIMGYSDLSLGLFTPENPVCRYLSEIKRASQRGALLTQQLLAFSRKQVVFPKILNLNDVVRDATKMLQRLVGEDVAVEFRPTIPVASIKADSGQIDQILMNLVVNARDAMPAGGKILIETAHSELDEHYVSQHQGAHAGQHVVLIVSDTGCGMDENIKSQIFEPFFSTKEMGKGTGLGLSTVYGIVKQSEGYIAVYSEPGKGTTFKIYFPMVHEKGKELVPPIEVAEPPQGSETILVVEDEKTLREVTVALLQGAGYRVLEAKDPEEALRIITDSDPPIDLLLTDVVMPGRSGADLATEGRKRRPRLRSVFMSGYTGDLVQRQGVEIDESSFLEKPFTKRSLLTKVYSVLHGQTQKQQES